jgi:putative acetyltransferase
VRTLENKIAELKRIYVLPAFRKNKIGYLLLTAAIELAKELNFHAIRLDTLASMTSAVNLYKRIGFKEIEPYRYNPIEGTKYFELNLRK